MLKQQVFKVKGMQRDASMANANGEFAYEILNMRLMPAEDLSGFSLTNEKGTTQVITGIKGSVIGQCPTNDSLIVFTTDIWYKKDYIYKIWEGQGENTTEDDWNEIKWRSKILYEGNLTFSVDNPIEALFNYESEDIKKVYWTDKVNQLRCINIAKEEDIKADDDFQFDSVKQVEKIPRIQIFREQGGSFKSGVIQYYITYFNPYLTESPIVYISPLLYLSHTDRGANANDSVNTAFELSLENLDNTNWEYIRIYATHRTSLDAIPEASIVTEIKLDSDTSEFIDYGNNRIAVTPSDLYFTGSKFVKVGTMTIKDQVLFLGNLSIDNNGFIDIGLITDILKKNNITIDTTSTIDKLNKLTDQEGLYYFYKNQLNNTKSITHYKYGEKYRFGISLLDGFGNWSNPIWIGDYFIKVPPKRRDSNTIELPCPSLRLDQTIENESNESVSIFTFLSTHGVKAVKPLVVFPGEYERKIIAQGVVCPTVYNLKDRMQNAPYVQSSWFMRPNNPVDLWGILGRYAGIPLHTYDEVSNLEFTTDPIFHKTDIITPGDTSYNPGGQANNPNRATRYMFGYMSPVYTWEDFGVGNDDGFATEARDYVMDDFHYWNSSLNIGAVRSNLNRQDEALYPNFFHRTARLILGTDVNLDNVLNTGSWIEFRHNYALRSMGWTFGGTTSYDNIARNGPLHTAEYSGMPWVFGHEWKASWLEHRELNADLSNCINGFYRGAELSVTRARFTLPANRVWSHTTKETTVFRQQMQWEREGNYGYIQDNFNTGNSAYYVDNSIITLNSPDIELNENAASLNLQDANFRIIGMIPITATVSDSSLVVNNPSPNPNAYDSVGYHKYTLTRNKNISQLGFRGVVASNFYYAKPANDYWGYRSTLLHPWQMTGTVLGGPNNDTNTSWRDNLSRKILSNLRYSAHTYFFDNDISMVGDDERNNAYISGTETVIGWKPDSDVSIHVWNKDDTIIKITNGLRDKDLVYSGSIDSIATPTVGENNVLKTGLAISNGDYNSPDYHTEEVIMKQSVGAYIKYKSSSHFVVAFRGWKGYNHSQCLWPKIQNSDTEFIVQETLPTLYRINEEGHTFHSFDSLDTENLEFNHLPSSDDNSNSIHGRLYEDPDISSIFHQSTIYLNPDSTSIIPGYPSQLINTGRWDTTNDNFTLANDSIRITINNDDIDITPELITDAFSRTDDYTCLTEIEINDSGYLQLILTPKFLLSIVKWSHDMQDYTYNQEDVEVEDLFRGSITYNNHVRDFGGDSDSSSKFSITITKSGELDTSPYYVCSLTIKNNDLFLDLTIPEFLKYSPKRSIQPTYGWVWLGEIYREQDPTFGGNSEFALANNSWEIAGDPVSIECPQVLKWTTGDTYYQRFDTLKTYSYADKDQNSVVDITSFMVETRINIDGRYDRNRGQDNNLQMSPTNFNLLNNVYSQRDNFFTYRILDRDVQERISFPNQITWSLTKTAGEKLDSWLHITLASILDLDGSKGNLISLKTFNNNIIAFQEKGLSHILFNSRAQITTSEAVPIQLANTGKVDGQQYFTTDVGCQDKWNIVTTPNGLYFIDYFNKSIYKFNGQLEDISTPNGFRSWCYENLNSAANIIGYYDVKNKEVMYYIGDTGFTLDQQYEVAVPPSLDNIKPTWLGFSELSGAFSSFYTYPKAWFANVQGQGLWVRDDIIETTIYTHQTGNYNALSQNIIGEKHYYGLTVLPRQDSNTVKTFNNVEFRADSFDDNGYNESILPFDTIAAETEYQNRTIAPLTYNQYRPSNLKKKLRTWRANIPRVNNGYNRFVNQWAKIGLWKMNPSTEKTMLHDLSVWYSE